MKNEPKNKTGSHAAGALLLAGGAYFAKGPLYRQAVTGVRALTEDLQARFLRQLMTADAATSRVLMWQAASKLSQPQVEYRLSGQLHDFVAVFPQCR